MTLLLAAVGHAAAQDAAGPRPVTVAGSVEAFYSWNFADPRNGITNLRGFDDRHDAITLSNVVLDVTGTAERLTARLALQFGHTPNAYTLAEPQAPVAGSAGESDRFTWRFIQQANLGYTAPVGRGLLVEAGIFLSPIGPESMAAKDDWNFSRSNLFFGLPFYHAMVRASYPVTDDLRVGAGVLNGWNDIVDNNGAKTVEAHALWSRAPVTLGVLYMGGRERARGAPEGRTFRHLFDAWAQIDATDCLQLLVHGDVGLEQNDFGTSSWLAGALYARYRLAGPLYVAVRGDWFQETAASNADGAAATIFWPATDEDGRARIASFTGTVEVRPVDPVSFRLELRHDDANVDMFFDDEVDLDEPAFTRRTQDTVTAAALAWF